MIKNQKKITVEGNTELDKREYWYEDKVKMTWIDGILFKLNKT